MAGASGKENDGRRSENVRGRTERRTAAPGRRVTDHEPGAEARLNVRLDAALKELIERAARYSGESVTAYTVSTLARDARRVVREHETTVLSDRDRDRFLALLDNPPAPNEALRRAARMHRKHVVPGKPEHR